MPLSTGSIYLFGQLLSCLMPISLLIAFATFFYRQARKMPKNGGTAPSSDAAPSTPRAPGPPAAPSHPYSGQ